MNCICFVAPDREFLFRHFSPAIAAARAAHKEVVALIPGERKESEVDGVRVITTPTIRSKNSLLRLIAEVVWFVATLRKLQPAVVVVYALRMCCIVAFSQRFLFSSKFVFVVTGIGFIGISQSFWAGIVRRIMFALLRNVSPRHSHFIFENSSDPVSTGIAKRHSVSTLMGAGVDPDEFTTSDIPPGPPFRLATVSRLVWSKGIDLAVDAVSALARAGYPIELHIYGAPDLANPRPMDVACLENLPGIYYHGASDRISAIWENYHAAIFTSRGGEGLPRALLEAAACGRACIVTAVPGCIDFVRDGLEGYVTPLDSEIVLKQTILKLIASPEDLAILGARARARVLETSTTNLVQAKYKDILRSLLDGQETSADEGALDSTIMQDHSDRAVSAEQREFIVARSSCQQR
ncbi:glycosyltransferase involved in cell wall biosynthesis [Bradyrhizobium sp. LB7.2]